MKTIEIHRRVNHNWTKIGEILVSDSDHRALNYISYLAVDEFFTLTSEFKAHPLEVRRKMQKLIDRSVDEIIRWTDVSRTLQRLGREKPLSQYIH